MNLSNIIIQGGLYHRAAQDYDEQNAQRGYAARAREHGVKAMESDERRRAADDTLLDSQTEAKRLRGEIDKAELTWQQRNQGTDQAMRTSELNQRQALQPGEQQMQRDTQALQQGQLSTARRLQPGADTIATEGQNVQLQTLKEQQIANIYSLVKMGDTQGALEALNKSAIIYPGRKFSAIDRGAAPAIGNDGKPLMGPGGKPASENILRLKAADGGRDEYAPERALEQLVTRHKSTTAKVGNNLVRQNPDGSITPLYEQDQFKATTEGDIYSGRTGLPPAAGGINPGGGAIRSRRDAARAEAQTKHIDERVKMGGQHIDKYFGINEFTRLDEKNQLLYNAAKVRTEGLVRGGTEPFQAANQAILEANDGRLKADGTPKGAAAPAAGAPAQGGQLPKLW